LTKVNTCCVHRIPWDSAFSRLCVLRSPRLKDQSDQRDGARPPKSVRCPARRTIRTLFGQKWVFGRFKALLSWKIAKYHRSSVEDVRGVHGGRLRLLRRHLRQVPFLWPRCPPTKYQNDRAGVPRPKYRPDFRTLLDTFRHPTYNLF
jgi:hypothetical protein